MKIVIKDKTKTKKVQFSKHSVHLKMNEKTSPIFFEVFDHSEDGIEKKLESIDLKKIKSCPSFLEMETYLNSFFDFNMHFFDYNYSSFVKWIKKMDA